MSRLCNVTLPLTPCQVDKLEFWNDDVVWILDIRLCDCETKNTVATATGFIDSMTCHHFVFQPFPEIFEAILHSKTLKLIHIFNCNLFISPDFDLKARHSLKGILGTTDFILVWIE